MLAGLDPASVARMRFPLGELTKPQVRDLAERDGLPVARTPDSQDLCFLAGTGREAFLARHGGPRERPGVTLDGRGRAIGRHRGAHAYTVGQRRGVGAGGGSASPLYVTATDVDANTVTVGPREDLRRTSVPLARRHAPPARRGDRRREAALPGDAGGRDARRRRPAPARAGVGGGARPDGGPAAGRCRRGLCDDRAMSTTSDEIRETFLGFFEQRDHRRLPSASLVPATFDASVLLTTAGMHPLKGYFLGLETPPASLLTSCQKCFRTTDIENVGNTARHLTFFEMLGNFSIGEYFKQGAVELAWELSLNGFGFREEDIWITVFEGDDELGLGRRRGGHRGLGGGRRAARADRPVPALGELLAGRPDRPVRPVQRAVPRPRRGVRLAGRPAGRRERALPGVLEPRLHAVRPGSPGHSSRRCRRRTIDTGLGLNRMALIQQGVETIFETDQFAPLMALGRELADSSRPSDERALRILADHSRAMTFLIADGVVPSNEDRGYILRRVMRRAIQQGHRIGIEGVFLPRFVEQVIDLMGPAYPELVAHARRSSSGSGPRRRASAARSSRARSSSTTSSTRGPSAPTTPSSSTTPSASRSS